MGAIAGVSVLVFNVLISISKWYTVQYELTDNGFMAASAIDSINAYLVGVRDNVGGILLKTQDGGFAWNEIHPWTIEEVFFPTGMQFLDINTGYVTAVGIWFSIFPVAVLYKTTDGGNTWSLVYGGGSFEFVGKLWEDVFFVDYNNGWAVGAKGDIIHTSDGGNNWISQTVDTSFSLLACYFISSTEGWVVGGSYDTLTGRGEGGVILHTTDGGNTWNVQIQDSAFQLWDVYFIDSQTGWACGYKDTLSPGLLLKTTDGGNTWIELYAPQVSMGAYGLYSIDFVDPMTGFAAGGGSRTGWDNSYFGVFLRTDDGGNNWYVDTVIFENDPWGVSPLAMDMASKNYGFAGGTRLSVFRYGPEGTGNREFSSSYKKGILTVSYKNGSVYLNSKEFIKYIELVDISGRIIQRIESFKGTRILDVEKEGIYFIRYKNSDRYTTEKLYFFK